MMSAPADHLFYIGTDRCSAQDLNFLFGEHVVSTKPITTLQPMETYIVI